MLNLPHPSSMMYRYAVQRCRDQLKAQKTLAFSDEFPHEARLIAYGAALAYAATLECLGEEPRGFAESVNEEMRPVLDACVPDD